MSDHFRRTDPRYDRKLEVEVVVDGQTLIASSVNISLGGMFVHSTESLPLKTPIRVRFNVPTQPEPIDVTGEIRWNEPVEGGLFGMGVRFNGLRAREVWALNRFFQS